MVIQAQIRYFLSRKYISTALHEHTAVLAIVTILTIVSLSACMGPEDSIDPGVLGDQQFQRIVEQSVTNHNLPALTVIVTEDGEVVESAVAGKRSFANSIEATEVDHWQTGSLSKGITATLAARLVELGFISWDTSIEEIFPEYRQQIHQEYLSVTLADLLRHRSGLARGLEPSTYEKSNTDRLGYCIRALTVSPSNNRGSFRYSNVGYTVAGLMLGQAAGLAWEDALQQYLFAPLEITNYGIGFPDPGNNLSQPIGHIRRADHSGERVNDYWIAVPPEESSYLETLLLNAPAGAVYLSKQDYIKYQYLHLSGAAGESEFLSRDSFQVLHNPPDDGEYAMGWFVVDEATLEVYNLSNTERVLRHGGNVGSWSAQSVILPDRRISVFMASNSDAPSTSRAFSDELLQTIFKRLQITE